MEGGCVESDPCNGEYVKIKDTKQFTCLTQASANKFKAWTTDESAPGLCCTWFAQWLVILKLAKTNKKNNNWGEKNKQGTAEREEMIPISSGNADLHGTVICSQTLFIPFAVSCAARPQESKLPE